MINTGCVNKMSMFQKLMFAGTRNIEEVRFSIVLNILEIAKDSRVTLKERLNPAVGQDTHLKKNT